MNKEIVLNEVMLYGIINNIYDKNKYVLIGLTCNDYSKLINKNFISLRMYKDLYEKYKGLFIKGKSIFVRGYLKTYSNKFNQIFAYVMVNKISESLDEIKIDTGPHIAYMEDGTTVWNGEVTNKSNNDEKRKEMEELLKEYK